MKIEPTATQLSDQASRLRELARPDARAPQSPHFIPRKLESAQPQSLATLDPRVVLISEFPVLQGGYLLAWRLAQQFASNQSRTAIVDLAPTASRLPSQLMSLREQQAISAVAARQPLWCESSHGRNLATWRVSAPGTIDIIAQPVGECPSAEQMPRICEQLLRTLGRLSHSSKTGEPVWNTLFILSEAQGIPLDSSCWRAADDIILLLPQSVAFRAHVEAAISLRVHSGTNTQRLMALWKQHASLRSWPANRKTLARVKDIHSQIPGMVNLQWPCPTENALWGLPTIRSQRSVAKNAKLLAKSLQQQLVL